LNVANGFSNSGVIELTSVANAHNSTLYVSASSFVNASGALFNALAGLGGARTLGVQLDNHGTTTVEASLTISKTSAAHLDTGTINVGSGQTLQINSGTFQIASQGILQGNGTLNVANTSFTNAGTVNPGAFIGSLSIVGEFPQTSSGMLNIEIGGPAAGLDYDQLQITGTATLGGTLNVGLTNGFRPGAGDSFEVIRFGAHSQEFDHINGWDIGGGFFLQPVISATNVVMVVIDSRPRIVFQSSTLLSGGGVEFTLGGTAGQDFVIEASTNLLSAVWTPILTNTNSGAIFNFIVTDVTNFPMRFYRAKQ